MKKVFTLFAALALGVGMWAETVSYIDASLARKVNNLKVQAVHGKQMLEKPQAEEISVLVEDATMTKTTLFFMVDGDDTENAYGITVRVNSKVLEGEFTLDDCEPYNTGVTDLSAKKWFDADSCYIKTQMLGSNTLLMEGILYTHNTSLNRFINAQFALTARIDADGELMDVYGGIVETPVGDTVKFKRIAGTAVYSLNGSTKISNPQKGSALMVICNDSVYYWKSPISLMSESPYWIKGLCDKQAQTVTFEQGQVNYLYSDNTVSTLGWCVRDPQASTKYQVALDHADAFVFDIKGDTLSLRDSQTFSSSTKNPAYFMGAHKGSSFIKYGDGATQLVRQYPVAERDTVEITAVRLFHFYEGINGDGYTGFAANNDELEQIQVAISGDRDLGTFATTGIYYRSTMIEQDGQWIDFYDGEVNIFEDSEGYKLQGVLIGTDEKAYVLDLIQPAGTYDYDAFKDLDLTISMDSVRIEIEEPGHFDVLANLRDYEVNLELFADPSNTVPPVGNYVISDTRLPGTALKSEGYVDGLVYSCAVVALKYNSDGSVFTNNLWMFVSGTISVNADGSILAVGKNSYGKDIRVLYTPSTPTDLPESEADQAPVCKYIHNGRLIIDANGKRYGAVGF